MAGKKNGSDPQLEILITQGARTTALLEQLVDLGNAHRTKLDKIDTKLDKLDAIDAKLDKLDAIDAKLDKLVDIDDKLGDIDRTLRDSRQRSYTYFVGIEERLRAVESKVGIVSPPVPPAPPAD